MPTTKKIKNDYNDWPDDELEHQQDRLYARLNNSKNDKTKFESILKDILDLENAMNRDPEKLSKKAKRFEYPWDKHKSQWKLNSKNEVEEDPENLKKVGRTKRSHKLDADVQTDIRVYINSVVANVNKYSETNETEFLTKSKIALMSLIRVFEQVENEHNIDQSRRISKKSHNLNRQTVDDIVNDLNDIVAKLKQYTETDDISYITRAKSISITLLRRIEQFEKDDIRLNRYLKSKKKMNNIQKINKMLKKSLENENLEQLADEFISKHPVLDESCLEFNVGGVIYKLAVMAEKGYYGDSNHYRYCYATADKMVYNFGMYAGGRTGNGLSSFSGNSKFDDRNIFIKFIE